MLELHLQNEQGLGDVPSLDVFKTYILSSLQHKYSRLEQLVRVVTKDEIQLLNKQYRQKNKPTNILSFPAEQHEFLDYACLGDLVICAEIVKDEAEVQNKQLAHHWAHLIIHGMLHLQGYDHLEMTEAKNMESLEIKILKTLGVDNPYNDVC